MFRPARYHNDIVSGRDAVPDILVRNLDAEVVAMLKARAASHGRSLAQEVRTLLTDVVATNPTDALELARRLRERLSGSRQDGSDSIGLIREARDR